jgi:hypothetical protein
LGDFPDEPLEGELPDEEFGGLLVPPDLTESDGPRAETVRLFDTTGGLSGPEFSGEAREGWERLTAAVLRAALVASCLRGAFPGEHAE